MTRRSALASLLASSLPLVAQEKPGDNGPADWMCPMDPDVRMSAPGKCPRCGMTLTLHVPERTEFLLELATTPERLQPGKPLTLTFSVLDPSSRQQVHGFETVHERLLHLFVVSENLQYFSHEHPTLQPDGKFELTTSVPAGGMYRLLADFYPSGSVPQLALGTFFVAGTSSTHPLRIELEPCRSSNLTARLQLDPPEPVAGLESKLLYTLTPSESLELYLGAWAHMLVASADLIDLLHVHPFLTNPNGTMQFNVIFPRPGTYRIWTQFQRAGIVNTTRFTVPVRAL